MSREEESEGRKTMVEIKALAAHLNQILGENPDKLVLSSPRSKQEAVKKVTVTRYGETYQVEWVTGNQSFQENLKEEQLHGYLCEGLAKTYQRLHAFTREQVIDLRVTKKGKLFLGTQAQEEARPQRATHNKEKNYLLPADARIAPLVDMGIFTKDGKVVQAMYHKYRQINRFIEVVDDELKNITKREIRVVDLGCGKGYLTFLLYHYLSNVRGMEVTMVGVDLKEAVMANCNEAAARYGYTGLQFVCGDMAAYQPEGEVDLVVSLHACDVATDLVLHHAVGWQAKWIFSMPCCQHEANGQMKSETLPILTRYGVIKEKSAALFTDAIRGNLLTACGYRVQVLDMVHPVHTQKNLMLRGVRSTMPMAVRKLALAEAEALMKTFSFDLTLYRMLKAEGRLPDVGTAE